MSIINPATLERVADSPWVRIGQVYTVLEVNASPEHRFAVRLDLGNEAPGLWDSEMFETTDSAIPSVWVAEFRDGGSLRLAPPRWLAQGFWESYFENDPDAVAVFEEDRQRIRNESAD
ncbi:hypothetical protein AB0P21_27765 [Kribbella sp. NPDC056861]|uniref:hypothetical protein n=1 Tax=Kribbella sp. NPDC056861 TaxID=3154857 RepID=UPI00343FE3B6